MRALVFHGPGRRIWEDKPKPVMRTATDAIIKMTQTTLCGSDLSIINGEILNVPDGLILGHEGVGIIEEVGSDISRFKVGDKVMVSYAPSCGKCEPCKQGLYSSCDKGGWTLGRLIDGTLAEYARIPDADTSLQHIPEGVDEGTLMMLKDILPTGFEYSVPDGQIQPGDTVVIFGSGHIGLTALLMAQFHSPGEIIMVDTDRRCLEAAVGLGATRLVHTTDGDALNDIMKLSGGKCVDVAIVANAKVALNSIWKSYGQTTLPLQRVLLMPSRRLCC
jgi:alcohol dehydrogenase